MKAENWMFIKILPGLMMAAIRFCSFALEEDVNLY